MNYYAKISVVLDKDICFNYTSQCTAMTGNKKHTFEMFGSNFMVKW